jgi:Protein of unknown function (DUF2889)
MPLPTPRARELLTTRTITCSGYLREDGLIDVEGHLADARAYDSANEWRGTVKSGEPVHEMWVRLTVDDRLVVREAACATDSAPYPTCKMITPNITRLVGLEILGGFKKRVRERIGGTQGCTHVVALIEAMSSVAVHALAGKRRNLGKEAMLGTYGTREAGRHPLVDSCHSYAADSEIVRQLWPESYRPRHGDGR